MTRAIEPRQDPQVRDLQAELRQERQALMAAEAELAAEQAAINRFRMHCRLKLDRWIERLLALETEKQTCLTQLELLRQAHDLGVALDDDFWDTVEEMVDDPPPEAEVLLPTDTPRDKGAEKRLYRQLARRFHPDLAKTAVEQAYRTMMMTAVNAAYSNDDIQTLYDLAGELDPAEMAALEGIETAVVRRLRKQILQAQRRQRRAWQRLRTLREENTARLYYKAQALDEGSEDWWSLVRRELEAAIVRREADVATLQAQLAVVEGETAVS